MSLNNASEGREYTIREIKTDDEGLNSFLFTLGFFDGENIKVISKQKNIMIVLIKDARYSVDINLAKAILV